MADIRQVDDLVRYGRLHGDTLVLEEDVRLVFHKSMVIPFALKISGNTSFQGTADMPELDFQTARPSICCSASAEHLKVACLNMKTHGDKPLFKFQRNFIKNISFSGVAFDVLKFGEVSSRSINIVDSYFSNPDQQPIELDAMNSLTLCGVRHDSRHPLFDLSGGKVIRDSITLYDLEIEGSGGLMIIGQQDKEGMLDLSSIPKYGITTHNVDASTAELLKVKREDGTILTLPKELTKPFFL